MGWGVDNKVSETVSWAGGQPIGTNFALEAGTFLWVKFDQAKILELGPGGCDPLELSADVNVVGYWCFPDRYRAYDLIRELGTDKINAVRMLDSNTGKWMVAAVQDSKITGENFEIPSVSVLLIDMAQAVGSWVPGM